MQTEFQKHLMQKFGSKGLCCDTTHGTTGYDFKLNSLLVLDEFEEGVPVAFCLSNRDNFAFMKLFFRKIRGNTGATPPCWFMSDTASQFNEAFALVNECSPKEFIYVWHVDKAWKEELRGKVGNFESQTVIYKYLRIALEQTDPLVFEDCLTEMLGKLTLQKETERFANYFQSFWIPKKEQWSFAYRVGEGINTSMFCESFHRVFKYKHLKGKLNKRVDKCLLNLIKFNSDRIFERFSKLTKGKYSSRMRFIKESHEVSKRMSFNNVEVINEKNFKVKSEDGVKLYDVSKVNEQCVVSSCKMVCPDCELCSHEYTCTCVDFYFKQTSASIFI